MFASAVRLIYDNTPWHHEMGCDHYFGVLPDLWSRNFRPVPSSTRSKKSLRTVGHGFRR